ncbi:hypothetical protein MG293_014803 [Ovis ammon polii]|uniref:Uncharacterized protein n=1 Tax=Ovis ammon polii TaxID=230172 RepID=A0AAD4TWL0_OVIAM|nr:hypothetical protein MG293_014803 [Ovis ammon polii]
MEAQKAEERGPERRSQCLVERIPDPRAPLRAKRSQFVRLPQQLTPKGTEETQDTEELQRKNLLEQTASLKPVPNWPPEAFEFLLLVLAKEDRKTRKAWLILSVKMSNEKTFDEFGKCETDHEVGKTWALLGMFCSQLGRSKSKCELCHHRAMKLEVSEPQRLHHKTEDNNNALITGVLKGLDSCGGVGPYGQTQLLLAQVVGGQHSHVEKFAAIAFGKERSSQVPASSSTKGRAVQ